MLSYFRTRKALVSHALCPPCFVFFSCTKPLDPSSKSTTLRWHFPLCVVYLHPTPLRCDLGVWPIRATSADSFALWLPVGFIQGEALAGDPRVQRKCQEGICSASLSGPVDWLPVTTKSILSLDLLHPAPFSALGVPSFSLPFKPRGGKGSLLLIAWRHRTSKPP